MEAVEAVGIGLTQDPLHFQIETEILRRLIRSVHLEILRDRIAAFKAQLERARVPATVRLTRGRDIEAACGQLAASTKARGRRTPAPARA